jgi:hypothetical protein
MLHGIDVTILNVTAIVLVIPDQMLPEAALPDAPLAAGATDFAQSLGLR